MHDHRPTRNAGKPLGLHAPRRDGTTCGCRMRNMNDDVQVCPPTDLSKDEIQICISLIQEGGAVDPMSVAKWFPLSRVVALKRVGGEIVGVGAIKPPRPEYALHIAEESGFNFGHNWSELGYVAVKASHRGRRISCELTASLPSSLRGESLFATTSNDRMRKTLGGAGFVRRGKEWTGDNGGQLSLWIRSEDSSA